MTPEEEQALGWFMLLCIVLGIFMTFHRHLTGRIVGAVLVLGSAAVLVYTSGYNW